MAFQLRRVNIGCEHVMFTIAIGIQGVVVRRQNLGGVPPPNPTSNLTCHINLEGTQINIHIRYTYEGSPDKVEQLRLINIMTI